MSYFGLVLNFSLESFKVASYIFDKGNFNLDQV